jgi:hypothetical protein
MTSKKPKYISKFTQIFSTQSILHSVKKSPLIPLCKGGMGDFYVFINKTKFLLYLFKFFVLELLRRQKLYSSYSNKRIKLK